MKKHAPSTPECSFTCLYLGQTHSAKDGQTDASYLRSDPKRNTHTRCPVRRRCLHGLPNRQIMTLRQRQLALLIRSLEIHSWSLDLPLCAFGGAVGYLCDNFDVHLVSSGVHLAAFGSTVLSLGWHWVPAGASWVALECLGASSGFLREVALSE